MKIKNLRVIATLKCSAMLCFGVIMSTSASSAGTVKPLAVLVSQEFTADKKKYVFVFSPKKNAALEVTLIVSNQDAFGLNEIGTYKAMSYLEVTTKVFQNGILLGVNNVGDKATCTVPRIGSRFFWAPMSTFGDKLLEDAPRWRYLFSIPNGLLKLGKEYTVEVEFTGNIERFLEVFGPSTLAIVRTQHR